MSILDETKAYQMYFEELTKIPHGSGNELGISDFLVKFAKDHGLEVMQDSVYNVVIKKNASVGYEDHPAVLLQAHIDMVNEKNNDVEHDFEKDPLSLYIEDGYLLAKGTTLGGDDGAGAAYIMSLLTDDTLAHPAIEALFTVQEESTMEGAFKLDPSWISARRLINIDGEEEDVTNTASAGGMDVSFTREVHYQDASGKGYELNVLGLLGGHSGGEIHKERGNANKLIARIAHHINSECGLQLSSFNGGCKVNAIPREAGMTFTSNANMDAIKAVVDKVSEQISKELEYSDSGFVSELKECDVKRVINQDESNDIVHFVYTMPTGLRHKSDKLDGLTTASENIGVITMSDKEFNLLISIRGALESYVRDMAEELHVLGEAFHMNYVDENWYPCWDYMENSFVRDTMADVYRETHGKDIRMEAIHGGLECGIFKNKFPDMDIVTMGPNLYDVHTPDEKLDLASFDRTYDFLCKLLARL